MLLRDRRDRQARGGRARPEDRPAPDRVREYDRSWPGVSHARRAPPILGRPAVIGRLLGHYRIFAPLGAGGMGDVYRARDEHLQRDVAVKVLPPGLLHDETARKRFRREALALSRLDHP